MRILKRALITIVLLCGIVFAGGWRPAGGGGGGGVYSAGNGLSLIGTVFKLRTDCARGERQEWDGTQWQCRAPANDVRSTHYERSHDFIVQSASDWLSAGQTGTGATTLAQSSAYHPGIADLQTGTATNGNVHWNGASTTETDFSLNAFTSFDLIGGWPTLSTSTDEYASDIGFGNSVATINQTNGCFFREDRLPVGTAPGTGTITAGSTNLQCWCCASGTCTGYTMDGSIVSQGGFTTVATPIGATAIPNTNFYRMKLVVTGATEADFYVDSGVGLTKRCVITSNIPTGAVIDHMFNIVKSAGTNSRSFYVDYAGLAIDLLLARSL